MPVPDLGALPMRRSVTWSEGGRFQEVWKGGEASADIADGVGSGGRVDGVDDKVRTLVTGEEVGGEASDLHGDPQAEGTEVAGKGTNDSVVPVFGAGGEALLATEGVVAKRVHGFGASGAGERGGGVMDRE